MTPYGSYQFDLGNVVQLSPGSPASTVTWRGQLKLRNPSGIVVRVNVYLLDNGFWDCYHEEELHAAWRW